MSCEFLGCNMKILRKLIEEHKVTCDYRLAVCQYCQEQCIFKDIAVCVEKSIFF